MIGEFDNKRMSFMDIRNADNVLINKAIIHVLDKSTGEILLSEKEIDVQNNEIREFLYNLVLKTLKDDKNVKATFNESSSVATSFDEMLEGDFVGGAEDISNHYFALMDTSNQQSVDLLFVNFNVGSLKAVCVMVLDYSMTYIHSVSIDGELLNVSILKQEIALPTGQRKPKRAMFFSTDQRGDKYLIVLDKLKSTSGDGHFLLTEFLNANIEYDYMAKTRTIKNEIEDFTRKNLKDDIQDASKLRSSLEDIYLERGVISPSEIIDNALLKEADKASALKERIQVKGIDISEKFDIDKRFVEKKMTNKVVTTDTGVTIRANRDMFSNPDYIEITENSDGTINYTIKNVSYTREK